MALLHIRYANLLLFQREYFFRIIDCEDKTAKEAFHSKKGHIQIWHEIYQGIIYMAVTYFDSYRMRIGSCDAISSIYLFGNTGLQIVAYHRGVRGRKGAFICTGIDKAHYSNMLATMRIYYLNRKPWAGDIIRADPAKWNVL